METSGQDLYSYYKAEPSFAFKLKRFAKQRGIELTIAVVGLFVGIATVLVSYKVGKHQEILQASRMTDSYFNGIVELYAKSPDENLRINLLMIARTEAIIADLQRLDKPDKIASVIIFISNLKPALFYEDHGEVARDKYIYLGEINLAGTNLQNLNLEKAKFRYTNLTNVDLSHSNLSYADLYKANLENANLSQANLNYANLQNANFVNANIDATTFTGAQLENAIWINGKRCKAGSIGQCIQH